MPRFLHTADWQIGRQFSSLDPEHAPILADARIDAVANIARLAVQHAVDAVLVAGDVFDAQTVSPRTIRRLFNATEGFAGPWLMISGNHDAALDESVWTAAMRLGAVPSNVHLLLTPEARVFADRGFVALPAPLVQRHTFEDLTAWYDGAVTPDGLVRVGIAHGCVQGLLAEEFDAANPIAAGRAAAARLDYLALGDWHGCRRIDERTWYSGTPEPDRFRDNASGQVLRVDIPAPGDLPSVTPLAVGRFRWHPVVAALQVPSDVDALSHRLEAFGETDVVDLVVSGTVDLAMRADLEAAIGRAEARARHLQVDRSALRLSPTDAEIAGLRTDGYVGALVAELRAECDAPDPMIARQAQDALAILAAELGDTRGGGAPGTDADPDRALA